MRRFLFILLLVHFNLATRRVGSRNTASLGVEKVDHPLCYSRTLVLMVFEGCSALRNATRPDHVVSKGHNHLCIVRNKLRMALEGKNMVTHDKARVLAVRIGCNSPRAWW